MKTEKSRVFLLLMPLLILLGCKSVSTELSELEKNNIKEEIRIVVEEGVVAANNHDPDAMMKVHWNSDDYLYIGNGTIIKGWESVNKVVTAVHSDPRNQSFTVDQKVVEVRVINSVTALVVAEGKFIDVPTKDGTTTENFTLSMLLEKKDGKWLKTVIHESWFSDDLFSE